MKKIAALLILAGGFLVVNAQSDLTLPFLHNVFQSSYLHPTVRSEHTLSIGFPGLSSVYMQTIHNGFVPSMVYIKEPSGYELDPTKIPDALNAQNMLFTQVNLDLFHLRMKIYNWDVWLAVRQNHDFSFFYPKDLFELAVKGNFEFAGETMDFKPLGLNMSLYREYTFGLAAETDSWVFGGRLSFLQGLSNAYLKPNSLSIAIDDDMYAMTGDARGTLYTTGIPIDTANMPDLQRFAPDDFSLSTLTKTYAFDYLTRLRNPGVALSGGVTYKFDQRTTFTFSFSDLGFIQWSDSTSNFLLKGNHQFSGIDALGDFLYGREIDPDSIFNEVLDNFSDEKFSEAYTVWLSPKLYLRANYKLARRTELGFQFYTTYNRQFYSAFSLGFQQGLGRVFNILLTGSINQRSFTNLGFGLVIKPGPVQIYMVADNYFSPLVDPLTVTNLNFRFGMNMVFGRVKKPQGLPYR